jgi:hypothetical protein
MKQLYILMLFVILAAFTTIGQVAVNTDNSGPDGSAMLDVKSATKSVLIPRISFERRNTYYRHLFYNPANSNRNYANIAVGFFGADLKMTIPQILNPI